MPEYGPPAPGVNGTLITVDKFLKEPRYIAKVLTELSRERFIADQAFESGTAEGGSVLYDRVTEQDLYMDDEIEAIADGAEFPLLGDSEEAPRVASVTTRGGAVDLTYQAIRRNRWDVVKRKMRRLSNSIIKKHDAIAVAALLSDPDVLTFAADTEWDDTDADAFADLMLGRKMVEQSDLGYEVDMAIIHPNQEHSLIVNKAIRDALPRENVSLNPMLSGQLAGLARIRKWIVSNRMTPGKAVLLQSKIVGSINDEIPPWFDVIDNRTNRTQRIQGARESVPTISEPKAAVIITGLE